jgi:hypothetical protein
MIRPRLSALVLIASAAVAATAPAALAEPPANATTHAITYACTEPPFPSADADFYVTITAPAVVRQGTTINLGATLTSADGSAVEVPAGGVTTSLDIKVGGVASTTVTATGLTNTSDVPKGRPVTQTGGKASLPAAGQGVYTFRADTFVTTTYFGTTLACAPKAPASIAAITVAVR